MRNGKDSDPFLWMRIREAQKHRSGFQYSTGHVMKLVMMCKDIRLTWHLQPMFKIKIVPVGIKPGIICMYIYTLFYLCPLQDLRPCCCSWPGFDSRAACSWPAGLPPPPDSPRHTCTLRHNNIFKIHQQNFSENQVHLIKGTVSRAGLSFWSFDDING
jgi:hypothetical protein